LNPGEHENVHPPQRSRPARTVRQCDRSSRIRYLVWRAGSGRRSQSDDDLRVSTMRGRTSGLGHYLRPVFAWTHLLHLEVHEHPLRRPAAWGAVIVRGKTDEPANFGEVYEAGPRNEVVARLTPHAVQILGRSDLPTSGKARAPIFPTPSKNRSPFGAASVLAGELLEQSSRLRDDASVAHRGGRPWSDSQPPNVATCDSRRTFVIPSRRVLPTTHAI